MRGEAPWVCDNCGKRREPDTNHWYLIRVSLDASRGPTFLQISKWDDEFAEFCATRHVCGAECRNILVERFFSTGSFEKPKINAEVTA